MIFYCQSCLVKVELDSLPEGWVNQYSCSAKCSDEIVAREIKRFMVGHKYLNVSFENFQTMGKPELIKALDIARTAVEGSLTKGVFIQGSVGSGKTHLLISMMRRLMERGCESWRIKYWNTIDLLRAIKASWDGGNDPVPSCRDTEFLFLDDLGMEATKDWVFNEMMGIFSYRYNDDKNTYLTSNLSDVELTNRYGSAFTSRLTEMCTLIEINAANYRNNA